MMKTFLSLGALLGGLSVILGALGAHALKEKAKLPPESLAGFETGVRYQMFHALALLLLAALHDRLAPGAASAAGWLWTAGVALFSGSIYLLATRTLLGIEGWRWLGPVTPLGGLCLILGWFSLLAAALMRR
jgi:uncharacterized membrane protein YgdD (TMEM256/DUF423 family)